MVQTMKITTLQERITKAQEKIEKKQNTITKKTARIEKLSDRLAKQYGIDPETFDKYNRQGFNAEAGDDIYWTMCDIDSLKEDIKRGAKEIEATKKTIEKYEAQLAGEIERESILIRDIPESMKRMQTELAEQWDAWDIERRENLKEKYAELGYKAFIQKYKYNGYEYMSVTDEQIHESNLREAKSMIINLYYRIKDITGEVTNWKYLELGVGGTALNGIVEGKEGKAYVESILAGGYNIQRLHVRVLVHDRS